MNLAKIFYLPRLLEFRLNNTKKVNNLKLFLLKPLLTFILYRPNDEPAEERYYFGRIPYRLPEIHVIL